MQIGRYFDQTRCIGCFACIAACRSWNELPPGAPDLIRLLSFEEGDYPNVSLRYLLLTCFHCDSPVCVEACPVNIIKKAEPYGQVSIDKEGCTSCRACQEACPYEAPRFGKEDDSPAMLCTLCSERLAKGEKPACVISCPVEALDVGPMDELIRKYGGTKDIRHFAPSNTTRPNIIFKEKK